MANAPNAPLVPASFQGRRYVRPGVGHPENRNQKLFTVEYFYDKEKGDVRNFELLDSTENSQSGVVARFSVVRFQGSSRDHVLHTSDLIPHDVCRLKVDDEKKKDNGHWVILKKTTNHHVDLKPYFSPRRSSPSSSSSDDERNG